MKRTLLLTLSLISLIARAQESQIMGGYLLDGNDSFEELEAAVLTDDRTKDRILDGILDGKGMRFHGASIFMTPESIGKETGSIVRTKHPFLDPGKYYISFCLTDIGHEIKERWADTASWDEKERFEKYRQDRIFFPAYIKGSYTREKSGQPLEKWGMNIGVSVRGCNKKE